MFRRISAARHRFVSQRLEGLLTVKSFRWRLRNKKKVIIEANLYVKKGHTLCYTINHSGKPSETIPIEGWLTWEGRI
jgi:hypothetical protein